MLRILIVIIFPLQCQLYNFINELRVSHPGGFGLLSGYLDDKRSITVPNSLFDTPAAGIDFFSYNYHHYPSIQDI